MEFGGRSLTEAQSTSLKQKISEKKLKRSVYLKNLEVNALTVRDKFSLPSLEGKKEANQEVHWSNWLNDKRFVSLSPAFPMNGVHDFDISLDIDATALHTETLLALKQTLRLYCAPNYDKFSNKIKHKFKGKTLSNCINMEIGFGLGESSTPPCAQSLDLCQLPFGYVVEAAVQTG
jgi:hypothetical protein